MLNPTNPNLYDVLRDIYSDILNVFPGTTLFHVGGDEVKYDCWRSSEEVQNWFSDQGLEVGFDHHPHPTSSVRSLCLGR